MLTVSQRRWAGGRPPATHRVQRGDRGAEHEGLRPRVDRQPAGEVGARLVRRVAHRCRTRPRPRPGGPRRSPPLEAVLVEVGGARDLPEPEGRAVGLAGGQSPGRSRCGRPAPGRRGRPGRGWAPGSARRGSGGWDSGALDAAAVHQEAVVDLRHRVHRVDVGDQAPRRLRLADREHAAGRRPPSSSPASRTAARPGRTCRRSSCHPGVSAMRTARGRRAAGLEGVEAHGLRRDADPRSRAG